MKWLVNLLYYFDKKQRHYVSDADKFIQEFDVKYPEKSCSQIKEINKHANIFNRPVKPRINWK